MQSRMQASLFCALQASLCSLALAVAVLCTHRCGLGAYILGAYNLTPPILEPGVRSLDWGPTVLGRTISPPILGPGMHSLNWAPTIWNPTIWGLQSHTTNFGTRDALSGLGAYSLEAV